MSEPYCIAHLVEQLLGPWCRANLRKFGFAQGVEPLYNADGFHKETRQEISCRRFL